MPYSLLCCQHQKAKQPCCSPNLCPGPFWGATPGYSLWPLFAVLLPWCQSSFSPRKITKSLPTFLLLSVGEKSHPLCSEVPHHSRHRHYFRINSNSITHKMKWTHSYMSKWQYQWQWVSPLFTGRSSKLWILPESISKQDASVFLDAG